MPTYEYECKKCGSRFELKRRFDEENGSPRCPSCKGAARRIFSPAGIVFKGPGFYVTDSRGKDNHSSDENKAGKADSAKKPESKADKVDAARKSESKADKVDTARKSESKADKVDTTRKPDDK